MMSSVTEHRYLAERRPSVVERRLSVVQAQAQAQARAQVQAQAQAQAQNQNQNQVQGGVIPSLAGLEEPAMEGTPEKCDVVICGTGLVESVLAAALAWQGSSVLHIDSHPYYGDTCSTLTIDQIKAWVDNVNQHNNGFKGFSDALLYIPRPQDLNSKDYGIDLTPRILFAKSDLLSLLIKSRVYKYLEFQPLSTYHTYENDSFEKLASTKEDIFTDQTLSLTTKRYLMKFMKFVFDYENQKDQWINYSKKPFIQFIQEKFNLAKPQVNELVYSIGLTSTPDILTPAGLSRVKRYLSSFEVYGSFPVMFSKYGGPGEISQGFCRSAAVAGATYKLDTGLVSYDPNSKIAIFTDGSKVHVTEKIICSPSQAPENAKFVPDQPHQITRLIAIVKKSCKEWMTENESGCIIVFPTNSLPTANKYPVQILIQSGGSGICPVGQSVWYLSTIETGNRARKDLETALNKLEESLLRESEEDGFDVSLDEQDVFIRSDGLPVINSVKLGKSFKDFIPKQNIQCLFKLLFTQHSAIPPFGIVRPKLFDHNKKEEDINSTLAAPDHGVVYSNMPSSEISYDGIVTEAKLLYEKIVGDDEDFFEVDFEDDDDEQVMQHPGGVSTGDNGGLGQIDDSSSTAHAGRDSSNEQAIADDGDIEMEFDL
ncbi:hypothetical protein PACTADRAFT_64622 [Pachysolen tannophilus NRRL Y-2460]|uniref:Rab proteins geranylgeranyltransferase n=1 Tax=Pachysolen tannophilus NRRL Y-2460 TaxID=669874 RepID=A0A1E4U3E9_PACTA|nr:hypothetical protein PACTADRAFT_64622 [Pachysolen tannophilus NRRL Y-2460]